MPVMTSLDFSARSNILEHMEVLAKRGPGRPRKAPVSDEARAALSASQRALGQRTAQTVYELLRANANLAFRAGDLVRLLGLSATTVQRHLKDLARAGKIEKSGPGTYYVRAPQTDAPPTLAVVTEAGLAPASTGPNLTYLRLHCQSIGERMAGLGTFTEFDLTAYAEMMKLAFGSS